MGKLVIDNLSDYWGRWQKSRVLFLIDLFGEEFFEGKTILELGAYNGWIGDCFHQLGAKVTCIDGRKQNADQIKDRYPHLTTHLADLDTAEWTWGDYDIIINFGLIYHLEKYHKEHIKNCVKHSKMLFLESVILDSAESEICYCREAGRDQSLTDRGGYPSRKYIEDIFEECGVRYTIHNDAKLNAEPHQYDWIETDNKEIGFAQRRFWIVG